MNVEKSLLNSIESRKKLLEKTVLISEIKHCRIKFWTFEHVIYYFKFCNVLSLSLLQPLFMTNVCNVLCSTKYLNLNMT